MGCKPCEAARMAKDGAKAAWQIATGQVRAVDSDTQAGRLHHCQYCPDLQRFHDWLPVGADVGSLDRCGACGCFVQVKTAYDGFACPKGRWKNE